jgi:oligopeptide transport system substrate-binding protein
MRKIWQFLLPLFVCVLLLLPSFTCQFGELPPGNGVLNLYGANPITLDPAISGEATSHTYIMQIFSGLVRLNDELKVVPDIAESWNLSEDGRTYTFYLRHGVKFHSGREVKAGDFKYSCERACNPATGSQTAATYLGDIVGAKDVLQGKVEEISGVKVIDNYTLELTIDAPKAYFLSKLTYSTAFVVDRDNVALGNGWWRQPDGTGPFKLKEWKESKLILERNNLYYGEAAKLKEVVFHLSGNPMAMYEKGQVDVTPVPMYYIDKVRDETNPLHQELAVTPELSLYYLGFNCAEPPFDDVDVRCAFCHAADVDYVIRSTLSGMMTPADGILPPGMPGYNEELKGLEYNVARAEDLIANSEYGNVSNLPPITITVSGYGNDIPGYLGAIIEEWRENLGIEVAVRQLEPSEFIYHLGEEKDEMFLLGWVADYPDPHNFLDTLFYTGSENNIFDYSNPQLYSLLDQAAVEPDTDSRLSMYQQAEQEIVAQAPCLPLCFGSNYILVKPYVKGYVLNPLGVPDLSKVCIEYKQH